MCHSKEQLIAMVVGFSWLFLRPESDLGQGKGANGAQSLQGAGGGVFMDSGPWWGRRSDTDCMGTMRSNNRMVLVQSQFSLIQEGDGS